MNVTTFIPLSIPNTAATTIAAGQTIYTATFDNAAQVSGGLVDANGYGAIIYWKNGNALQRVPRAPDVDIGFNQTTTRIAFPAQASIAAGATDTNYAIALATSSPPQPTDVSSRIACLSPAVRSLAYCNAMLFQNAATLNSGPAYYAAAPVYAADGLFSADNGLGILNAPELFSDALINGIVTSMLTLNGTLLPFLVMPDGTNIYQSGAASAALPYDSVWMLPLICQQAYLKNGDFTTWNACKATLKTAMLGVPLDSGLFYADPASSPTILSLGFYDGYVRPGHNTMGTVFFLRACTAMSQMYLAQADGVNAAIFANLYVTTLTALQSASNPLWDSKFGGSPLLVISDHNVNSRQTIPDIFGTCHACFMGYLTTSQAGAVSDWLHTNYSTIFNQFGFCRQSTTPVTVGTYDDAFWSYGINWVLYTLAINHPADATTLINTLTSSPNSLDCEWIGTTFASIGGRSNLVSPFGAYAYCRDYPTIATNTASTFTSTNYTTVWPWYDDCQTETTVIGLSQSLTKNPTNWDMANATSNFSPLIFNLGTVDSQNYEMYATFKIVAFSVGDLSTVVLAGNVGPSAATGLSAAFRANGSGVNVLDIGVAWGGSATAFSWTSGVLYRLKLRRIGTTISLKVWLAGTLEPANYTSAFTISGETSSWFGFSAGWSEVQFSNVTVNRAVSVDPVAALQSAIPVPPQLVSHATDSSQNFMMLLA